MALPFKLKDMMLFMDGINYRGQASSVTLPKLTRKYEDWRGAGMDGMLKIDMGAEAMELEYEIGGPVRDVLATFGETDPTGQLIRFAGAYQAEDGDTIAVEVTGRGRHEEIDMGEAKVGESPPMKSKLALAYYKLDWNGSTVIEIDVIAGTFVVDGVDRRAAIRAALGI